MSNNLVEQDPFSAEETEPYNRDMSPSLIDITTLLPEQRQIDILTEQEDRQTLVSDGRTAVSS